MIPAKLLEVDIDIRDEEMIKRVNHVECWQNDDSPFTASNELLTS